MSEKIKVTIDRSKWRTGGFGPNATGSGITELRNKHRFQCCLGFCVKAFNSRLPITGMSEPRLLGVDITGLTEDLSLSFKAYKKNTQLANRAMQINDDMQISRRQREAKLLRLFKNSPYQLEFVGEYREYF
jgi:hypothetical protein